MTAYAIFSATKDTPAHIHLTTPESVRACADLAIWSREEDRPLPYSPITIAALESAGYMVDLDTGTLIAPAYRTDSQIHALAQLTPFLQVNPAWEKRLRRHLQIATNLEAQPA